MTFSIVSGFNMFLIFMAVSCFSTCGGSSSGTPQSTTISGHVADGYLSGATVFWDCNGNHVLDTDVIFAITDAAGHYVFDVSGGTDVDDCPLAAEATETTIDMDTNMPVCNGYTLI